MLKCSTKASTLSNALKLCSSVHPEVNLTASPQGIDIISSLDFEFIWVTIPFDSFKQYDLSDPFEFNLDAKEIITILNKLKDNEIKMELTKDMCKIGSSQGKSSKQFNLRVLEPRTWGRDEEEKSIARAKSVFASDKYKSFGNEFSFPSKELFSMVDDMMMEEGIRFTLDKDILTLSQDDQTKGSFSSSFPVKGMFDHMQSKFNYTRITSISEILSKIDIPLEIRFGQDSPVMIRHFGELHIRYIIAPLIDND
jgi:hypothetical protein